MGKYKLYLVKSKFFDMIDVYNLFFWERLFGKNDLDLIIVNYDGYDELFI